MVVLLLFCHHGQHEALAALIALDTSANSIATNDINTLFYTSMTLCYNMGIVLSVASQYPILACRYVLDVRVSVYLKIASIAISIAWIFVAQQKLVPAIRCFLQVSPPDAQ